MLSITHSGQTIADVIASVRGVPTRLVPYAAATALTRCAKHAQTTALPDAMRQAFDSPTAWTLNSLRIEPATKDKLSARVMVKNQAGGVVPESVLFPEVEGGQRKKKRSERALGYMGVLSGAQYAIPKAMQMDAAGNVKGADVRSLLTTLKKVRAGTAKTQRAGRGKRLKNDLFVGKPRGGDRPEGIWRREGHKIRALYVFTNAAPDYQPRLDFEGVVAHVARDRFAVEFQKAVAEQMAKGAWK